MTYYKIYFCDRDNVLDTDFAIVSKENLAQWCGRFADKIIVLVCKRVTN